MVNKILHLYMLFCEHKAHLCLYCRRIEAVYFFKIKVDVGIIGDEQMAVLTYLSSLELTLV